MGKLQADTLWKEKYSQFPLITVTWTNFVHIKAAKRSNPTSFRLHHLQSLRSWTSFIALYNSDVIYFLITAVFNENLYDMVSFTSYLEKYFWIVCSIRLSRLLYITIFCFGAALKYHIQFICFQKIYYLYDLINYCYVFTFLLKRQGFDGAVSTFFSSSLDDMFNIRVYAF